MKGWMITMNWTNYGDVNPIENGGIFTKEDSEEFPNCYYIVRVNIDEDKEETWFLDDMYVDLNNTEWAEWDSVNSYSDIDSNASDIDKVIALTSYYGSAEFGQTLSIEGENEVIQKLKDFGIEI